MRPVIHGPIASADDQPAGGDLFDSHGRTGDAAPPGRALVADRLRLEVTNAPPHAIHEAAIRPKRAYEAASPDDGVRILVDRLWPRGVSKANAAIDRWMKEGRAEDIPEARRLLYVAMTRAKDRLTLTWCKERGGKPSGGTMFLDEMGLTGAKKL